MEKAFQIRPGQLTISRLGEVLSGNLQLELSAEAKENIAACREYLDEKTRNSDEVYYGINTGFGDLCDVRISRDQVEELQQNLVMSHACGMGDAVPADIVRLMLLLKVQNFSYGYSGVQVQTAERLLDFFNEGILPVVYEKGSLGASGDLAPLAHLSLPLLGMGEVMYRGEKVLSNAILQQKGWEPVQLRSKEGLALLNGTQFMASYGSWILIRLQQWLPLIDLVAALSMDAFDAKPDFLDQRIHAIRNQTGQQEVAERIRGYLEGSEITSKEKQQVQDPYSFRCIPQVHGASNDVVRHVQEVFEREISGVTDNPNVFHQDDHILSGGNFHGQPLAMALDYLAVAMAELGSISERRTYKLLNGKRNLPPFLTRQSGLHSGLMIPQYTAAAIASENKQLCSPASVDSITSSNGQEDHVSMGANAATKALRVFHNLEMIIGIELLTAAQALEFRRPQKSSPAVEGLVEAFRSRSTFDDHDRTWYVDMEQAVEVLRQYKP